MRILLRLRKDAANLPLAPPDQDVVARMENLDEPRNSDISSLNSECEEFTNLPIPPSDPNNGMRIEDITEPLDSDMSPDNSQGVQALESSKMNVQYGNVTENKGSGLDERKENRNVAENTGSYAPKAGMLMKMQ